MEPCENEAIAAFVRSIRKTTSNLKVLLPYFDPASQKASRLIKYELQYTMVMQNNTRPWRCETLEKPDIAIF
ncbi:MAG: hypothetical protein ACLR9I_07215 [Eisenbergiella sp.]